MYRSTVTTSQKCVFRIASRPSTKNMTPAKPFFSPAVQVLKPSPMTPEVLGRDRAFIMTTSTPSAGSIGSSSREAPRTTHRPTPPWEAPPPPPWLEQHRTELRPTYDPSLYDWPKLMGDLLRTPGWPERALARVHEFDRDAVGPAPDG